MWLGVFDDSVFLDWGIGEGLEAVHGWLGYPKAGFEVGKSLAS